MAEGQDESTYVPSKNRKREVNSFADQPKKLSKFDLDAFKEAAVAWTVKQMKQPPQEMLLEFEVKVFAKEGKKAVWDWKRITSEN